MPETRSVTSFVAGALDLAAPPTSQPALRAWGDAIIDIVAERDFVSLDPAASVRSRAIFGWLQDDPPAHLAYLAVERRRVALRVDASLCPIARIDLIDPLFDFEHWRSFAASLVDRGFDEAALQEELIPLTSPSANMHIDRARSVVTTTPDAVLLELLAHFEPHVNRYLASWRRLSDVSEPGEGIWEVIIPPAAILEIVDEVGQS